MQEQPGGHQQSPELSDAVHALAALLGDDGDDNGHVQAADAEPASAEYWELTAAKIASMLDQGTSSQKGEDLQHALDALNTLLLEDE